MARTSSDRSPIPSPNRPALSAAEAGDTGLSQQSLAELPSSLMMDLFTINACLGLVHNGLLRARDVFPGVKEPVASDCLEGSVHLLEFVRPMIRRMINDLDEARESLEGGV